MRLGFRPTFPQHALQADARNTSEFLSDWRTVPLAFANNARIDTRWSAGNADNLRKYAAELVALAPDVIMANGGSPLGPLQQATRTVPIVFVNVTDPVGAGFVDSLARPGGNITGFTSHEYGISGKWLELLKEIAIQRSPRVRLSLL
jgi:ABC-type uncharacterized transport system substrate-binding protein